MYNKRRQNQHRQVQKADTHAIPTQNNNNRCKILENKEEEIVQREGKTEETSIVQKEYKVPEEQHNAHAIKEETLDELIIHCMKQN